MIQLNLLPDVKLEYIKAQRQRRLVTSASIAAAVAALLLLILLLSVSGLQKKHISDLTADIKRQTAQLQAKPDISKILTVQNQLDSLTALHAGKPAAARVFDYLNQVTPTQVSINNFNVDFTQNTITITGDADALASVNKYVDTLKFTTYTTDVNTTATKAFSNVVLSSFAVASGAQSAKPASYTISMAYDRNIFDITQKTKLSVPSLVTTRATAAGQANDLFQASQSTKAKGSQ